jgi:hypothetical protein
VRNELRESRGGGTGRTRQCRHHRRDVPGRPGLSGAPTLAGQQMKCRAGARRLLVSQPESLRRVIRQAF